jgi:heme-degrading monooxygenase HmoA
MAHLFVHHKVADYKAWRPVFDELDALRQQFGQTSARVYRNAADPNELVIMTEWPSLDAARAYSQAPELRQGMQRAGVISQPEVLFLEEA